MAINQLLLCYLLVQFALQKLSDFSRNRTESALQRNAHVVYVRFVLVINVFERLLQGASDLQSNRLINSLYYNLLQYNPTISKSKNRSILISCHCCDYFNTTKCNGVLFL